MSADDLPRTMTAAYITRPGPADSIQIGQLPTPIPGPTDVLVEVEAVTANFVDTLIRAGRYPTPLPFPFVVGRDLVGTVQAVGAGVAAVEPGARVWCNSLGHEGRQGSFAQFAVVPAERLYRLPEGVDPRVAVAVAHPAATAYLAWFVHARLRPGETVYVGGAAGNVGMAALTMAVQAGARVLASARPEDHQACRHAGAEVVVDYAADDLGERLREAAPDGLQVFWDTSGHQNLDLAATLVAPGGRILLTAEGDATPTLPVRSVYTRNVSLHGFVISRAAVGDLARAAALINRMLAAGQLTAKLAAEHPLSDTPLVHALLEQRRVRGRILLRP